jgi:beta-phosphoglucomutase-like phosphatase (HAD superfamily)
MPSFQLIAFDLDGTIADTERVTLPDVIEQLNDEHRVPVTLEHWFAHYHGLAGKPLLDAIARDYGVAIDHDEFHTARGRRIKKIFTSRGVPPGPGLFAALKGLKGRQLAVCSNSNPERVHLTLAYLTGQTRAGLHLTDLFDGTCFCGIGQAHAPKPAPDIYLAAAAHFQASPARCLAVEDSAAGAAAALAAGFVCIGYTGLARHRELEAAKLEAAGVRHIIGHWDEFLPLVAKLEAGS